MTYNWEEWRDTCLADPEGKRTVVLRQHYDFECRPNGFRMQAYNAAKKMGCKVQVQVVDSLVILRFYRVV